MNLADANLLLYAYDAGSQRSVSAREWLEEQLNGSEPFALAWASIHAFLRIATHSSVFVRPLAIAEAIGAVDSWLMQPAVHVLEPGPRYWSILQKLLIEAQVRGNLVSDAHLAALAIEHGATLCTTDRDFTLFPGLRLLDPVS
ncbi:MAG TPA: TA system VapC family ribonuclease toxin [Thermoanaerobaculia bacterium]|nr:TA system VapC family ribonuclease toxin [Thermoanaerobaculia bacterium]